MAGLKIDAYYDLCCGICGRHRSTDYSHGMERNTAILKERAYREGWTHTNKINVCPICNEVAIAAKNRRSDGWTV